MKFKVNHYWFRWLSLGDIATKLIMIEYLEIMILLILLMFLGAIEVLDLY